jgi:hypothetical protein
MRDALDLRMVCRGSGTRCRVTRFEGVPVARAWSGGRLAAVPARAATSRVEPRDEGCQRPVPVRADTWKTGDGAGRMVQRGLG